MSKVTHYVTRIKTNKNTSTYEDRLIDEKFSEFGEKLADLSFVFSVMSHLLGNVLTTVEATTPSDKQAKAIKDIIRGHFSREMEFVSDSLFDQDILSRAADNASKNLAIIEAELVSIEEALKI